RALLMLIDEHRASRRRLALGLAEFLREHLHGALPRDRHELAPVARHRTAKAIRIVKPLQCGLPATAQGAAIDRMIGVPFRLDRTPVAGLDDHTATGSALAAGGGVEGRDAWNRVVRRRDVGDELLHLVVRVAGGRGCGGAGDTEDFEEVAPL